MNGRIPIGGPPMIAMELKDRVRETIRTHNMTEKGDRIVSAVSGGPDSVCMTHILNDLSSEVGFEIVLAHVNYHTRGEDSNREEELCVQIAGSLGLPIEVKSLPETELQLLNAGNFQTAARRVRYDFFNKVAADYKANKIAVGHTSDDVVETMLMHFIRGSGLAGLSGIRPTSGRIIRPLVELSRQEIQDYLGEIGAQFRIDKSNLEPKYLRNRIRNELIPMIEAGYNPEFRSAILRTAHIAGITRDFVDRQVNETWERCVSFSRLGKVIIEIGEYSAADRAVRFGLIRKAHGYLLAAADRPGKSLDLSIVEAADRLVAAETGKREDLKNGIMAEKGSDQLVFFKGIDESFAESFEVPGVLRSTRAALEVTADFAPAGRRINADEHNWSVSLDASTVKSPLEVRSLVAGDRVRLLNSRGNRKLSDIFIDRKIPRSLRPEVPIVTSAGEIVWIIGLGISDHVKIVKETKQVLKLRAEPCVIKEEHEGVS